mgnify:CR=1 FL=1
MSYAPYRNRGHHEGAFEPSWPGFTGHEHIPFAMQGDIKKDLVLNGIDLNRLNNRRGLLTALDGLQEKVENAGLDNIQKQAFGLLTANKLTEALDINKEPKKVLERYGKAQATDKAFGGAPQSAHHLLLARRLVEAGVRCVTVAFGAWDWHANREGSIEYLSKKYLPVFDHAVSVFLEDLEERGLLGSRHLVSTIAPDAVAGMINLDIAGYGDTIIYGPSANRGNAPLFTALHHVCADADTQCLEFPVFPPSDDRSFQRAGIPNISLATLPRREAHQLWLVLNTDPDESGLAPGFVPPILQLIHTDNDTQDKLDAEAMRLAYNVVKELLLRLDQHLP